MTRPQAVIFDIGNVLVEWSPERLYDARLGRAERERLFAEVPLAAMNLEVDRGAALGPAVEALAAAHPAWAQAIRWWRDDWHLMFDPVIPRSVRLLRALRARGVPVFALTNFGEETFARAQGMHPFLAEFDRAYVSAHLRLLKPDPAIYAAVEADCRLPSAALLFADDRPENVAAAEARGWQGHLFDGPEGWAGRLVAAGLLTAAEAA